MVCHSFHVIPKMCCLRAKFDLILQPWYSCPNGSVLCSVVVGASHGGLFKIWQHLFIYLRATVQLHWHQTVGKDWLRVSGTGTDHTLVDYPSLTSENFYLC